MSTSPIGAAHSDPWAQLGEALAGHASALADLQQAATPSDSVHLSQGAIDALRAPPPSAEDAVGDAMIAGHEVQAVAAVARADEARFQALVFVLAHHGPPL
jgi:hypothetical protein